MSCNCANCGNCEGCGKSLTVSPRELEVLEMFGPIAKRAQEAGIIFTFDLDGFIFLIGMKLLFWAIGAALSFLAGVLATALALALSPFVYPFALYRAFHGEID